MNIFLASFQLNFFEIIAQNEQKMLWKICYSISFEPQNNEEAVLTQDFPGEPEHVSDNEEAFLTQYCLFGGRNSFVVFLWI